MIQGKDTPMLAAAPAGTRRLPAAAGVATVTGMSVFHRTLLGAIAWGGFVLARVSGLGGEAWSHAMLLFTPLVLAPMALALLADEDEPPELARAFRVANVVQLPAGLLLGLACWLPAGRWALLAALPWALLTFRFAAIGVVRLRRGGFARELDRTCADVALGFAGIGGIWLLADRSGFAPLGFPAPIVALTAVHFHHAGLLLPLVAGLVQRELFFLRLASRAAVGVVLGVPAVAVGITATQIGWGLSVERAAACGLALAGLVVGVLQVRIALEARFALLSRGLLAISGASLFIGMVFAVLYALRGTFAGVDWLNLPQMRSLHGTLNAIGFGLGGVLAWYRVSRERAARTGDVAEAHAP